MRSIRSTFRPHASWWQRVVLSLLAMCLGLQGVALVAERTQGPAHFHAQPQSSETEKSLDGHRYAPELAAEATANPAARGAAAEGAHRSVAHHDHAIDPHTDPHGAVVVAEEDGAAGLNPQLQWPRSAREADGVLQVVAVAAVAHPANWARESLRYYRSQISSPLERPPRA